MKIKKEEIISIKTISLHFYSLHKTLIIKQDNTKSKFEIKYTKTNLENTKNKFPFVLNNMIKHSKCSK